MLRTPVSGAQRQAPGRGHAQASASPIGSVAYGRGRRDGRRTSRYLSLRLPPGAVNLRRGRVEQLRQGLAAAPGGSQRVASVPGRIALYILI